jgi:chemosensory pili system protein ChpC
MANKEIRTIVAPLLEGHILLPNVAVAEIRGFTFPEPLKKAPNWVLGELIWHGWQVPVISFEHLIDENYGNAVTSKARILIIKTLGESTQVNYIGLIIQGLPRLRKITIETLVEKPDTDLSDVIFSEVSIDELDAFIPELRNLTRMVEEGAYGR